MPHVSLICTKHDGRKGLSQLSIATGPSTDCTTTHEAHPQPACHPYNPAARCPPSPIHSTCTVRWQGEHRSTSAQPTTQVSTQVRRRAMISAGWYGRKQRMLNMTCCCKLGSAHTCPYVMCREAACVTHPPALNPLTRHKPYPSRLSPSNDSDHKPCNCSPPGPEHLDHPSSNLHHTTSRVNRCKTCHTRKATGTQPASLKSIRSLILYAHSRFLWPCAIATCPCACRACSLAGWGVTCGSLLAIGTPQQPATGPRPRSQHHLNK